MSKRERLDRVLSGEDVDRLPISLWRHFYVEETAAAPLAERLVRWHRRFDFDFLKINVRAQYHSELWGAAYRYFAQEHQKPQPVAPAVSSCSDFAALERRDVEDWPLGEMLDVVRLLRRELGSDDVLLMTVFNPMSVAHDLCGGAAELAAAIGEDPASVHRGLRAITDTFHEFTLALLDEGCDGLFLATTHVATAANFTLEQVEEFGRPYDLEILDAASGAFMNMLHVCKSRAYVRELADYPVRAINWDSGDPTNPSLAEMRSASGGKALVGGLSQHLFAEPGGGPKLVAELGEACRQVAGRPLVVGSTCTIPTETIDANIDAVVAALRG
jgi:uroporphyrinogen decarboxylase